MIKEVTENLGIVVTQLYRWWNRYTPQGVKIQYAPLEEECCAFRLEVAELRIERDRLKKQRLLCEEPQI